MPRLGGSDGRAQVGAALRAASEVVGKVGGELRLERIETTRIIGSDIEALQREVRQLKTGRLTDFSRDGDDAMTQEIAEFRTYDAEVVDERPSPRPSPRPVPVP